jgi:hypothetical protein
MYFSIRSSTSWDTHSRTFEQCSVTQESSMMTLGKPQETAMKRTPSNLPIPLHEYRPALLGAVPFLGDRHLLAEPMPRLNAELSPYFAESPRWHPSIIAGALAKITG